MDHLTYCFLVTWLPTSYLLEQSLALLVDDSGGGRPAARVVGLQPFLPGFVLLDLIDDEDVFQARLKRASHELTPLFWTQIARFLTCPLVDMNPSNFIVVEEGSLVYVDYQPTMDGDNAAHNRARMFKLLEIYEPAQAHSIRDIVRAILEWEVRMP
jgi:hypothetical protein